MKSRLLVLLLALMLVLLCSCKHSHTFSGSYSSDDTNHWYECECGEKDGLEEHKWNSGAVTLKPTTDSEGEMTYTCTICRAKKTEKIDKLVSDHTHTYSDSWSSDATHHWHAATCEHSNEVSSREEHSWNEGELIKAPSETEAGAWKYECLVCEYEHEIIIPCIASDGLGFTADSFRKVDKLLHALPLTIEAEVYLPKSYSDRAGVIFGNYSGSKNWNFEVQANGVPRLYYTDTTGANADFKFDQVDIRTGDWAHVAITFDYSAKTISLYLNGELAQAKSCTNDMSTVALDVAFVLGGDNRGGNTQYFKGEIRSLTAFSTVRTADEIKSDYEGVINPLDEDVILHYYLSESDANKDIPDYSGNGYNIFIEWFSDEEVELDYAYSFAVVGDTQVLCQNYSDKMEAIYDWILDNKDSKKIAHVFGLGDITEEWGNEKSEAEWIKAHGYISKLDGKIPYSLIRGNHDETSFFNEYFANETYMSQFDGFMVEGDIRNSYKTFTVGSTKYMLVTLDYGASDEELEWANALVAAHPDHKVIVTTHAYLYRDGTTLSRGDASIPSDATDVDDSPSRNYNDGQQIWEKFVSQHPNIVLVMSGHDPCEDVVTTQSVGAHGNVVTQMLIDPQGMDAAKGGLGMVCMLYFSEDGSQMEVEWYSTDKQQYYKSKNQFTVDLSGASDAVHKFEKSYDEKNHFMGCDCGYTYDEEAHSFDGGVVNSNGDKEYTCSCGYVKVVPHNAVTTFMTLDGVVLGVVRTDISADGLYRITAPVYDGYTPEYDKLILNPDHDSLINVVYYSPISVWDGSSVSTSLKGAGTEADPYLIESGADLAYIAQEVNKVAAKGMAFSGKYFKMTKSIDLGGHDLCIGTYPGWSTRQIFGGFFDGNHCTIRGLDQAGSLFGAVEGGWLKNLSVYGTVSGIHEATGGIVAYVANGGVIENLTSYVTVTGVSTLGGIVGNAENGASYVINCANYGDVTGSSWSVGGIAGSGGHNITDCVNFGNIKSTGSDNVGGIAGTTKETGSISDCYNYGNISTTHGRAGGIVGLGNKKIIDCINYGEVNAGWDSGGILGYVGVDSSASIIGCINNGNVTGGTGIGGIFGFGGKAATSTAPAEYAKSLTITNCINNGTVSGTWGVGGIAANTQYINNVEISGCVNNGTLNAQGELGGIVGKCSGKVTECTNNGAVVGTDSSTIGSIVGCLNDATYLEVINTTNNNTDSNVQQIIGKITDTTRLTVEEFNAQPITRGNGWDQMTTTRIKIYIKILMDKGTKITFTGDTSVYRWSVIETTNQDSPTAGTYTDSKWNNDTAWTGTKSTEYVTYVYDSAYLILTVSLVTNGEFADSDIGDLHNMFTVEGKKATISTDDTIHENNPWLDEDMVSINHRGWYEAPENTLSAYRESKEHGFKYVECDVLFTKDGIPVLLHDETIDRTSNGSGNISDLTYAELLQYDFSYDDNDATQDFSAYRGEQIPTFAEFIALCKELELHPYIEIKGTISNAQAQLLVTIVSDAGMLDSVSWLSLSGDALAKIVSIDDTARVVWVMTDTNATKIAENNIPFAQTKLMTGKSEVVFDLWYSLATQDVVDLLTEYNIPLEVWTVNDANTILNLHPYVSGVTSDKCNAKEILSEAGKLN